jgi:hypothetical protein
VHDTPERTVVRPDGARAIHMAAATAASRTSRQRNADRPPGRQRVAAAIADRRGQRKNRAPAGFTDRPPGEMFEQLPAGGAGGREKDGQDRIGCSQNCRFQTADCRLNCRSKSRLNYRLSCRSGGGWSQPAWISMRSAFPHRRSSP